MGESSATALKTNIENMKLFVVLALVSVALGGMDYEMTQKWQKLKAMESCWGEENMKLVMVDMKKAIAKCSHEDAPELSLPPYRSAYRFTNTMINKGNDYEHINDMASMFAKMMHQMKNRNTFSPYSSMSSNSHHGDSKMDTMKMMMQMKNMIRTTTTLLLPTTLTTPLTCSATCSTNRATTRAPPTTTTRWAACLSSRTCSTPCASRGPLETTLTSETGSLRSWLSRSTNLPAEIAENSVITGETFGTVKLGEVKMFSKCCEKAKMKLCMHQDIKNKVESNFGPMEDILQETQLTEHEFFPLVMQLLHGKEMDYMTGGM